MKKLAVFIAAASAAITALASPNDAKVIQAAQDAVHSIRMNPAARSMKTDVSPRRYDLLVRYSADLDPEGDARALLQEFVSRLMKAGIDPSGKTSINVCSVQIGLKTPTGKDAVRSLGCLHYNPFTEAVTFDRS
ncbi:TPA: hypothetical protein ACXM9H_000979 [Burkholderia multivorans]|uniref:hypothetical protein n=1 Tax=Burkholderia multivorans TaxID=87883 RepID=UPI000CFE8612|nr:hypothetical protein [Burkholderia multivorans]PRD74785.1 hypothetical protein C6P75_12400 [Burkholderia multivorans]